jgi:hypothetical protein
LHFCRVFNSLRNLLVLSGVKDIYKYFGSSEDLGCDASGEAYIYRKGNKKYTHHRFVTEVLEIIAAGMLDDIKGLLAAAPVVGLMVDESVDVSGKQQLIYY